MKIEYELILNGQQYVARGDWPSSIDYNCIDTLFSAVLTELESAANTLDGGLIFGGLKTAIDEFWELHFPEPKNGIIEFQLEKVKGNFMI